MADKISKLQRSETMRAIKSKDTKIEVAFRKILWKKGFRYRKNSAKYFGKPDIVLRKYRTVIFIDSCFWHGCRKHFRLPATNKIYWENKIKKNIARDKRVTSYYKKIGWKIFRFREHDIRKDRNVLIEKVICYFK